MKNAMQLKGIIKNMAAKTGIKANALLQNYMLERLLERISVSEFKWKFILKGGMLISAIVGLDSRTTMDMDATIKGVDFSKENLLSIFEQILKVQVPDDVKFILKGIEEIREGSEYGGYRISIEVVYETVVVPLKIDISTGDIITPKEVLYSFDLLFEDRNIEILAYNLETVLAEKFETIISRGILNTRARDFYDIYILTTLQKKNINKADFKKALTSTATKRETLEKINDSLSIIEEIKEDKTIQDIWKAYTKRFIYANDIEFEDSIAALIKLFEMYSK
ncbi:MAG: nucleotidyl transferase AbiEii/AbiGii toxin family protein [Candidatus Caldatribacteriota bacterium]|nr:nucleotidyl transferase AbiEii/AbiGii toxin family protein [Candidatus Caldatribacteriota bacterium]